MISATTKTTGEWKTEAEAWEDFDRVIDQSAAFKVYREVEGFYVQPRSCTEDKSASIDRILCPLRKAIDAGWPDGAFGVEGKKSGTKIGKIVAQAMDYSRCAFHLDSGFVILLPWVFIFPADGQLGDLASVMAHNRIGTACLSLNGRLCFSCAGINGIVIGPDGDIDAKKLPLGQKRGSR